MLNMMPVKYYVVSLYSMDSDEPVTFGYQRTANPVVHDGYIHFFREPDLLDKCGYNLSRFDHYVITGSK